MGNSVENDLRFESVKGTQETKRMIFDGHLDLAMNAIEWNRDLTQPVAELRRRRRGR